jgi:hypothetical protein
MPDKPNERDEPTQSTPTGHKIPVPKRKDVFRDLENIAKSRKRPSAPADGSAEDER